MAWYSQMGRRVWPYEIWHWMRDWLAQNGPTVRQFWGEPQHGEENAMATVAQARSDEHRDRPWPNVTAAFSPAGRRG